MVRKITLWLLWAGSIAYAFLLTPERQAASIALLKNLFTVQRAGINPIIKIEHENPVTLVRG